jgi:hypothetical protein
MLVLECNCVKVILSGNLNDYRKEKVQKLNKPKKDRLLLETKDLGVINTKV